ncbi:MAG: S41 family peptidase [Chitinophagaceae bacterium]
MDGTSTKSIALPLILSLVLIVGMFLGFQLARKQPQELNTKSEKESLDDLVSLIEKKYVDSISKEKLLQDGIDGILSNLDPHTVYINKEDLPRSDEELEGSIYGIGIEYYISNDTATISYVLPQGPSASKNFKPGDQIITIKNDTVAGKKLSQNTISKKIKGQKQNSISIGVKHLNQSFETITVQRDYVNLPSVYSFLDTYNKTAYIQIQLFSENTYAEFYDELITLKSKKIDKLIIDVRNNPGGYMDAATDILDELVAGKQLLVSTKSNSKKTSYYASKNGLFEKGKIAVLINENAASASEILAGTLQDLKRATIIGAPSYGKGLVQEQFDLPNGAAIRITTARYYLPSGRNIQRAYDHGRDAYYVDHLKKTSYQHDTSNKNTQTNGIVPDLFQSDDTSFYQIEHSYFEQNIMEQVAQHYFLKQKEKPKDLQDFLQQSDLNNECKILLQEHLEAKHLKPMTTLSNKAQTILLNVTKAHIAKLFFGQQAYYQVLIPKDPVYLKALRALQ